MTNRASYQQLTNIKLGTSKRPTVLASKHKNALSDVRILLHNATNATSNACADVALMEAFRIVRTIILERKAKS
jgi:hypothetical protein